MAELQHASARPGLAWAERHERSGSGSGTRAQERLVAHLRDWLGSWPPSRVAEVVGATAREQPGWDGRVLPAVGLSDGVGLLLSVAPGTVDVLRRHHGAEPTEKTLALALGRPPDEASRARWSQLVFRWSEGPTDGPDIGVWRPTDDPCLPPWLRPFNGDVLVALDEHGSLIAAAGRKRHTSHGHEIAVVTEPAHRGRGLARLLVAQMARRIADDGAVALYLHATDNAASARVAAAAGFPDRGWRLWEL